MEKARPERRREIAQKACGKMGRKEKAPTRVIESTPVGAHPEDV